MRMFLNRVLPSLIAMCILCMNIEQAACTQMFKLNQMEANFNHSPSVVSSNTIMLFATTEKEIDQKLKAGFDMFHPEKLQSVLKPVKKEFHAQDNIDFVIAFPVAPRDTYTFSLAIADHMGKPVMVKRYDNAADAGQKVSRLQVMKFHFEPDVKLSRGIYTLQLWVNRNKNHSEALNYQFKLA